MSRKRIYSSLAWSFFEVSGTRLVRFGLGLLLARLLLPEQFGLFGIAAVVIAISSLIVESGFGAAIVQRKETKDPELSAIFALNLIFGGLLWGCITLVAPYIARFYGDDELSQVLPVLGSVVFINAFRVVPNALLEKALRFKVLAVASLVSSVVSGGIGVYLALGGAGVWALVWQQIIGGILGCSMIWVKAGWKPQLAIRFRNARPYWEYGSHLLSAGLLNTVFENCYSLVIPRLFGLAELGFYNRAQTLQSMPTQTLSNSVMRVLFPVFSAANGDPTELKRKTQLAIRMLSLLMFPVSVGILATAEPLVLFLLTEKWIAIVPYLQLFCLAGLLYPIHLVNLNALKALGRSKLFLKLEVYKKILVIANLSITWVWGVQAMIIGQIIISIVALFINLSYSRQLLGYGTVEQIKDIMAGLVGSAAMGIAVVFIGGSLTQASGLALLAQVVSGVLIYGLLIRMLFPKRFRECLECMPRARTQR